MIRNQYFSDEMFMASGRSRGAWRVWMPVALRKARADRWYAPDMATSA